MTTPRHSESVCDDAEALRSAYVEDMSRCGDFHTPAIRDAFAAVRRERFAPGVDLTEVYQRDNSIITRRDPNTGEPLSSISAAWVQATQLAQSDIEPGMRVWEVGSGGSNAALIAELVGVEGHVTTMDIDPWVISRTRQFLADDYPQITVLEGDAENGVPDAEPWDRILVTVDAPDIPSAWTHLKKGGRLVAPLTLGGISWSFAFVWDGVRFSATDRHLMGFVPMRGLGARNLRRVPLHESVNLLLEDDGTADTINATGLSAALTGQRVELNSGVLIGGVEPFDDLELWLLSQAPTFGLLRAEKSVIDDGLVARSAMMGAKTIISGDSFAYRASRGVSPDRSVNEFTVIGHGPDAERVAATYVELIREWDARHRHGAGPTVLVYPRATPADLIPAGRPITKRHTTTLISWPTAS